MYRERSCLGQFVETTILIIIFAWIFWFIMQLVGLVVIGVGYVVWKAILKPICEGIDDWVKHLPPPSDEPAKTERDWTILFGLVSLVLLPLSFWLATVCPLASIIPWTIYAFAVVFIWNNC